MTTRIITQRAVQKKQSGGWGLRWGAMAERRRGKGGADGSEDSGLEVEQHHIMELPHGKTHTHFLANVQSVYSATMERRTVMSSGFPPAGKKKTTHT